MPHANYSRKMSITFHYMEHLAAVTAQEVLVVPMQAYDQVLRLPPFRAQNPEIDWNLR